MGMLNSSTPDINEGVVEFHNTEGAVLLDVRTPEEYKEGHVPGSINLPLQGILRAKDVIADVNTPIFTYCLSGGRSSQAVTRLGKLGYTNVKNIGGINQYRGEVEK